MALKNASLKTRLQEIRDRTSRLLELCKPYVRSVDTVRPASRIYTLPWELTQASTKLLHQVLTQRSTWGCEHHREHEVYVHLESRLRLKNNPDAFPCTA